MFFDKNVWVLIQISLKFIPKGPIDDKLTLVQVKAWCLTSKKPLSEAMMGYFSDEYMHHLATDCAIFVLRNDRKLKFISIFSQKNSAF